MIEFPQTSVELSSTQLFIFQSNSKKIIDFFFIIDRRGLENAMLAWTRTTLFQKRNPFLIPILFSFLK